MDNIIGIDFSEGTLLVSAPQGCTVPFENWCVYDERFGCWRSDASAYSDIVMYLYSNKIPYLDNARKYQKADFRFNEAREARPYQTEAVEAWKRLPLQQSCSPSTVRVVSAGFMNLQLLGL